uniref:Uncharacterized protein n=1 Tax=Arundo donax TaxID=35708 RepID=A0A0A9E4D2_ARUDO
MLKVFVPELSDDHFIQILVQASL